MNISEKIKAAEGSYKQKLEEFFNRSFPSDSLISHGLDHHRRVWNFAMELLTELGNQEYQTDDMLVNKLIIACYLHDSGMSSDTGPRHGKQSRLNCEVFLKSINLPLSEFGDLLNAIEYHDNKEFLNYSNPTDLLTILSAADDLDALGFTGIYRYLEIYIIRKVSLKEIGLLIRRNVENRFQNFNNSFNFIVRSDPKYESAFEIIDSFFEKYNVQVADYSFGTANPSGYCGIAEFIHHMILKNISLSEIFAFVRLKTDDEVILSFFSNLENELTI